MQDLAMHTARAVVVLALCAAGLGTAAGAEPILIGGVGPLSQPGAVQAGQEMRWAMQQGVADVNADGGVLGRKLELVFYDTQNQPDVAASVAEKLAYDDKVVAVIGEYHSGSALAQVPTYNRAGLPAIFSETWNDKITGGDPEDPNLPRNPPTIFRIAPTSSYAGRFIADWLINGLDAREVVQVYEATEFGLGQGDVLEEHLSKAGVKLAQVQVELNQPDYSSVLARLAAQYPNADAAVFDITGESSFVAEQNAAEVGLFDQDTACVANQQAQDAPAFWRAVPDGAGCAFRYVGLTPGQYNDRAKSLAKRYEAEFGGQPKVWVFESYDSVWLVADAIERAGSADAEAMVKALEDTSFVGTQGQYRFPYGSDHPLPADEPSWLWHQWPNPPIQMIQYFKPKQPLSKAAVVWPRARQTRGTAWVEVQK